MIRTAIFFCAVCGCGLTAHAGRPFVLPLSAHVTQTSVKNGGWAEAGTIGVVFVQAEASFKSAMAQSGWKYLHAVALSKDNRHTLYTWRRGDSELTLMLRRVDVNKTSFTWGLAKIGKENERSRR